MSDHTSSHVPSELEICRRTSRLLSQEGEASLESQLKAIRSSTLEVDKGLLQRFAARTAITPRNDSFVKPLSEHFRANFPAVWARAQRQLEIELLGTDELSLAISGLLGLGASYDKRRLDWLAGCYAAYRPYFRDPAKTMVMSLRCGVDADVSKFELGMSYVGDTGLLRRDSVEGRIIPYEQSFLFLGNIAGNIAPVIFILSRTPLAHGKYERGEGVMLVGAQGMLPTASALAIYRKDELPDERIIAEDANADLPEWESVQAILRRGVVNWL